MAAHRSGILCDASPGLARDLSSNRCASRLHREIGDADHMTLCTDWLNIRLHLGTTSHCNPISCNLGWRDEQHALRAIRRLCYFVFRCVSPARHSERHGRAESCCRGVLDRGVRLVMHSYLRTQAWFCINGAAFDGCPVTIRVGNWGW